MRVGASLVKPIVQPILDFCYPPRCEACDESCASGENLCSNCESELKAIEAHGACETCARPLAQWGAPCPYCMGKGLRPFERIAALGIYEDPLKELIHHMKYHRRWSIGEEMAQRLLRLERVKQLLSDADVLVPVPLYRWRQISRGYNQSDVIARWLKRNVDHRVKVVNAVKRIRNTPSQTMIQARTLREANVKGAFRLIRPGAVKGKHVVVVDDVLTTGATLVAVGRAIAEAESKSLSAIVLAVADPRNRGFEAI